MKKEIWIYKKGHYIKATRWDLWIRNLKNLKNRFKIVDTNKYCLIPWEDKKRQFALTDKEYEDAQKLYKEKGALSYEFFPCGGIGWGVRVHTKTGEIIDITDVDSW